MSPNPIGSSLRFLKYSQILVVVYIILKNINAVKIPSIEFKLSNNQKLIIEYNNDMIIIGMRSL